MNYMSIKRRLGFSIALIACIILIPLFAFIMAAIKVESRGPVFFKQKRVGLKKNHFNILKFRTMYIETPNDTPTHLLADPDVYITRVGKFLRKTSLDELPQLFNILKGEMAFVGPRPALWNQYDLIDERDKYNANDALPGLTGWAQINGRDELPIEVKAKLDGEYVTRMGFLMDTRCFIATLFSVIKSEGVVEGGTGTITTTKEVASTKE
ncbi:sugar transferase [Exiguobacterium sp. s133]|uniref:sugar transferase n=1 Tax=Exiguobacterium sp. s133 TaxID=2751213 RepID=UPI003338A334